MGLVKSIKELKDLRPDWFATPGGKKQPCSQASGDRPGSPSLAMDSDMFLQRQSICAACDSEDCYLHAASGRTRCWRRARIRSLLVGCPAGRWPKLTAEQVAAVMSKK